MNLSAVQFSSDRSQYRSLLNRDALRPIQPEEQAIEKPEEISPSATARVVQVSASLSGQSQQPEQSPASIISGSMGAMTASAAATASTLSSNNRLPDLYSFSNRYLYDAGGNTYAKIDTDQNGVWDRTELEAYAEAYEKATGKTLDVDDIITRYGTGGVLNYSGQMAAYQDDALGISDARDELLRAEMGYSTGSQQVKINSSALQDFVDKYTYGYPGKMYAKVDQNSDGVWTLDELMEYSKAYEKATGISLDAEALFAKYDRDGSGALTYTEMNEMYRDDALGLSRIRDAMKNQEAQKGTGSTDSSDKPTARDGTDRLYNTLMDLWGTKFSDSQLRSLTAAFSKGMQQAALLDAFMGANRTGLFSHSIYGMYGIGNTHRSQMAYSLSMLNLFV